MTPRGTHAGVGEALAHDECMQAPKLPARNVCALCVETAKNLHLKQIISLINELKRKRKKNPCVCMWLARVDCLRLIKNKLYLDMKRTL